jgi:glutamine amidotransferase
MIIVIDYNVGNVKSVCNAFANIGCQARLSCDPAEIEKATGLVLPGVAAFGYAVNALGSLAKVVKKAALDGKPLLGICVGYQMLFEASCEHGNYKGLGLIKGDVIPIPPGRVIPHMGWNMVELPKDMALFKDMPNEKHFYFAHSYYAQPADANVKIAYTEYGFAMPASIEKGNIYGTQFHPEKSGPAGLAILKNFTKICKENC